MVSTDIEKMAVIKVQEEILRNKEYLSEYINSNDKTPMWDGNIYVYNNPKKEKKYYQGKIETQVKGEEVKKIKSGNSKYRIEVETLEAYNKDKKGTLLLVCKFIDLDNYQLYYANLLPIDLDDILRKAQNKNKKGKDKISIDIKPIRRNAVSSLKNICLNFLRESNKQLNIKIMDINELKDIKKVNFQITGIKKENDLIEYMLNNDIYTYATFGDNNEMVALRKSILYSVETKRKYGIKVNDKLYYDSINVMHIQGKEVIKMGKGIILDGYKVTITPTGNINERIKDVEFFIDLYNYQKINIDGDEFKFPLNTTSQNEKIIVQEKEYLKWLKDVKNVFEKFNIFLDTDLNIFNNEDFKNINNLIELCNGNFNKVKTFNKLYYTKMNKYKIIYIIRKRDNGKVDLINFYSDLSNVYKVALTVKNEEILVSPYLQLTENDLLEHINLDYEVIKKSFDDINIKAEPAIVEFVLNCLRVYDKNNDEKILNLALDVNNKLLEKSTSSINIINKLQILKRMRKLETDEIAQLISIRDKENDKKIKVGISILLESNFEFNKYFNELSSEERKEFEHFPIFNLKNNKTNNN